MTSGSNAYIRTQPYETKGQLHAERVFIPPPNLDYYDGTPSLNLTNLQRFDHLDGRYGSPSFMCSIPALCELRLHHTMMAWKYEDRSSAQPILPFLFLGPGHVAKDLAFVQSSGITMLVAVRNGEYARRFPQYLNPAFFHSTINLHCVTLDLDTSFDFIQNLRRVVRSINDHLEASCVRKPINHIDDIRGKVFVFCESGNERSTVLVCAYLMIVYGVDAISAIQIVQSQRFSIDVKEDMRRMLLDLGAILVAERQVAAGRHEPSGQTSTPERQITEAAGLHRASKRSIDEADENDEEMGDDTVTSRPGSSSFRCGSAPFADAGN